MAQQAKSELASSPPAVDVNDGAELDGLENLDGDFDFDMGAFEEAGLAALSQLPDLQRKWKHPGPGCEKSIWMLCDWCGGG